MIWFSNLDYISIDFTGDNWFSLQCCGLNETNNAQVENRNNNKTTWAIQTEQQPLWRFTPPLPANTTIVENSGNWSSVRQIQCQFLINKPFSQAQYTKNRKAALPKSQLDKYGTYQNMKHVQYFVFHIMI